MYVCVGCAQPEPEHDAEEDVHAAVGDAEGLGDEHDTYHNETHDKIHVFGQAHYIPKEGLADDLADDLALAAEHTGDEEGGEYDNYHNETHDKVQFFGHEHYYPRGEADEHHVVEIADEEIADEDGLVDDELLDDELLDENGNSICDGDHCGGCKEKDPCDVRAQ